VGNSPAIAADGTIFIGGSRLYAVNSDGTLNWSYYAGGSFSSSSAIGSDGLVYVVAYEPGGGNSIYAVTSRCGGLANTTWPKYRKNNQNTGSNK
jgi:outer membrane protein assembly factor BamB